MICRIRHPILTKDILWTLSNPDDLHGEGGYYTTNFEAAIEFIREIPYEDLLMNMNDDDENESSEDEPQEYSRPEGNGTGIFKGVRNAARRMLRL